MFVRLPDLLFGDEVHRTHVAQGEQESHVDRRLNVLASAAAHKRYFRDAENIFLDVFNRQPLCAQPRFVADMGCGDGSWLAHIYKLVSERTNRGRALRQFPLTMVGADYNPAALEVARTTLNSASLPTIMVVGDITDPDSFARELEKNGLDIRDGLQFAPSSITTGASISRRTSRSGDCVQQAPT